jgi:hypothetical protein
MWTWVLRAIAAILAGIGAGLLSLADRAIREATERLLNAGLPAAIAVLAVVLIVAAGVIAASPAARPSLRP